MALTLNLNNEQMALMRTALLEYQRSIRQQERYHCSGPSAVGIGLCQRRLVLESILSEVDAQEVSSSRFGKKYGNRSISGSMPDFPADFHPAAA
jgi:hypothetical protein